MEAWRAGVAVSSGDGENGARGEEGNPPFIGVEMWTYGESREHRRLAFVRSTRQAH